MKIRERLARPFVEAAEARVKRERDDYWQRRWGWMIDYIITSKTADWELKIADDIDKGQGNFLRWKNSGLDVASKLAIDCLNEATGRDAPKSDLSKPELAEGAK